MKYLGHTVNLSVKIYCFEENSARNIWIEFFLEPNALNIRQWKQLTKSY